MPEDKKVISVGVSFTPIVQSVNEANINDVINLTLISGLNYYDIVWVNSNNNTEIPTNSDSTVTFKVKGLYKPKVMGHILEVSQYWITVI